MKKILCLTAIITSLLSSTVFADAEYNDNYYDFNTKAISGELMIEAAKLFKIMGYNVNWDASAKTVIFSNDTTNISFISDTGDVTINGETYQLSVKPIIIDEITYIPISLLEKLDITVDWDYKKAYPLFYSKDYETVSKIITETTSKDKKDSSEITTVSLAEDTTEISTEDDDIAEKKQQMETYSETMQDVLKDGWNTEHNEFYFEGEKVKGLQYIDGKMYNFGMSGTLLTGIFTDETGIYGYDDYGNAYNGFLTRDGKEYYFDDGRAYTVPSVIDGKMYNFSSDGTFVIGWTENDGNKSYNNEFGYPVEGIVEIDGKKYLFVDSIMKTGAIIYNDKNYLLHDDGTMTVNELIGEVYYGTDGIGRECSQEFLNLLNKVDSILNQFEKTPYNIYDYVAEHVKYKFMPQENWTTMANTSFDTGRGACYHFVACVDILLKRAGYETRVVRGTGHYTTLHYWNQVKIDNEWTNVDACNKYICVDDSYLIDENYTFEAYEYPEYN